MEGYLSNKAPAFQLYAADFYMDTSAWTVAQVGAYFRLLIYQWVNGSIPADNKERARIAGIDPGNMQKCWYPTLERKFVPNGEGDLINLRMEEVRKEQKEYRKAQSESGLKGIEIKKIKGIYPFNKSSDPSSDPSSEIQALQSSSSLKEKKDKRKEKIPEGIIADVIKYLNEKAGTNYKKTTKATSNMIKARFGEGFTWEQFKKVIDIKTAQWLIDEKMKGYLRPETLFAAKHFESYLNEKPTKQHQPGIDQWEGKKYIVYGGLAVVDGRHIIFSPKTVASRYGVDEVDCIFMNNGNELAMKGIDKSKYKILRPREDRIYDLAKV